MLHCVAHVIAGQKIFVHAVSGAVGGALLRLGQLQGAQLLGTTSLKKQDEMRQLGAVPFDYSSENWIAVIQEFGGVDAVFDPLGLESFDESYSVLKKGGVLVGYGMNLPAWTRTPERPVIPSALKLLSKNLFFWSGKRTTLFGVNRDSKNFAPVLEQRFKWLRDGTISVPMKATFKLHEIQKGASRVCQQCTHRLNSGRGRPIESRHEIRNIRRCRVQS